MSKKLLTIIVLAIVVIGSGFAMKFLWKANQASKQIAVEVSSAPTTRQLQTSEAIPGWKMFKNDKIEFSYPENWSVINNSYKINATVVTFQVNNPAGSQKKIYQIQVDIGFKGFDGNSGLMSTKTTSWLGQTATLQEYEVEDEYLVLTTNDKKYQLVMELGSGPVSASSSDSKLFLQIANTIKIK